MRLGFFVLLLAFLTSCKKEAPTAARIPPSPRSPQFELPVASRSIDPLSTADTSYIEVVINHETLEIHHPDGTISSTATGLTSKEVLGQLDRKTPDQETIPPLLISAPPSTKFGPIRAVIRSAAAAGVSRIQFLVKSEQGQAGIIQLTLPENGAPDSSIEPYFIQIDHADRIFTGTGPSRQSVDQDPSDTHLKALEAQLELLASAARSAGYREVPCQIYVHPEAHYQRLIDLLALLGKWELKPSFIDLVPELQPLPVAPAARKPRSPIQVQPLPLAPPK